MKRRRFVKALAVAPAVPAVLAQQAQQPQGQPAPGIPTNPTQPVEPPGRVSQEQPKLEIAIPDQAAEMMPRYFSAQQFAALKKLCDILMPAHEGHPGALEAQAPEFLDFLIGDSPPDRQDLYKTGLDILNSKSQKQFKKPFAEIQSSEADTLLVSLREAWTYETPPDPLARFLRAAKQDVRTATMNSREYASSSAATSRRAFGPALYWYPLD